MGWHGRRSSQMYRYVFTYRWYDRKNLLQEETGHYIYLHKVCPNPLKGSLKYDKLTPCPGLLSPCQAHQGPDINPLLRVC